MSSENYPANNLDSNPSSSDLLNQFANLFSQESSNATININTNFPGTKLRHQNCVILKIISPKSYSINLVRETLQKFWKTTQVFYVSIFTENTYIVKFESQADASMIFEGIPWIIKADLYALEKCVPNKLHEEYNFETVELGIQIHGLPVENLCSLYVYDLVSQIGDTCPVAT